MGFSPLFAIFLFSYLLLKVFLLIEKFDLPNRIKGGAATILILLALNPINQGLLLFNSRDIVFSLGISYLGVLLLEKRNWSVLQIFFLTLANVFLSDLRQEAKIYLIILPILFLVSKQWKRSQILTYMTSLLFLGSIYFVWLPTRLKINSFSMSYQATIWVMPLSEIFHDLKEDQIDPELSAKIDKVLNVKMLKEDFSPTDIFAFHKGAFRRTATQDDWTEFKEAGIKLIGQHPELYFKNRINLFLSLLNVGAQPLIFADEFRIKTAEKSAELISYLKLQPEDYVYGDNAGYYKDFIDGFSQSRNGVVQLLNSLALPLIFCLLCLGLFKWIPEISLYACLVMTRVPIVMLIAPASSFRYLYTVLLYFIFMLPIFILSAYQWRKNRAGV